MGKGDRKTTKGKRFMGSYGKTRKKKQSSGFAATTAESNEVKETKKDTGKKPKKSTAKKPAAKKSTEKKSSTKKAATKKTTAKKATNEKKAD